MTTLGDIDAINEGATFAPQTPRGDYTQEHDGTRPCLTVAGIQIYGYVDLDQRLVVSLHFDTPDDDAAELLGWDRNVPTVITVGGSWQAEFHKDGSMTLAARVTPAPPSKAGS